MAWIKRNLYFLIISVVAVAMLGLAGFYTFSKWKLNNANLESLTKAYDEFDAIIKKKPNAGNEKIDNIAKARQYRTNVLALIEKVRGHFAPIPTIPDTAAVKDKDFYQALRRAIADLNNDAAASSVILQPDYYFSFQAQRELAIFSPGSPERLAAKLGEIHAICDVLFQAKINSLYNLRRERVSDDDIKGPSSDYFELKSVTNNLAVLTPYEVTFYCFHPELAGVLAGFAGSPYGFIVKGINVESGSGPAMGPDRGTPGTASLGPLTREQMDEMGLSSAQIRRMQQAGAPTATAAPVAASAAAAKGNLNVIVDEKLLKVTMLVEIVKMLPPKASPPPKK